MSQIFIVNPQIEPERIKLLNEMTDKLNEALEIEQTQPDQLKVIKHEAPHAMGSMLWEESGLDATELIDAIEETRDSSTPVRIIVTGKKYQHFPWELLYHSNPDLGFLARQSWVVISRRTNGTGEKTPQKLGKPLRLLLFISSPEGINPEKMRLDYEKEEEALFTALDVPWSNGEIDIDVAEDGCFSTLEERLKENQYHAVILSMHGGMTTNKTGNPEYGLLFEDENDWSERNVAGSVLARMLENLATGHLPGLIVLSACRSALIEPDVGKAVNSVAFELHKTGCERVVGMRLSVKDIFASAFTAELFRLLAKGTDTIGRAVTQARIEVQRGKWILPGGEIAKGEDVYDIFGQWTLPVLLDRTIDGPLIDKDEELPEIERFKLDNTIPGDQKITMVSRANFIGRRSVIRQHLKPFLDGRNRCLMFTGPGGMGKSTIAGFFLRRFLDKHSNAWLIGFEAPFNLRSIEIYLANTIEDDDDLQAEYNNERQKAGFSDDLDSKLRIFAKDGRNCCFVLDNLESIQDDNSLELDPADEDSAYFLKAVCSLQDHAHVILTGRYTIKGIPELKLTHCELHDAPYGDILHRMKRLKVPELLEEEKRWIYDTLGGNHRAIEWTASLLADKEVESDDLKEALQNIKIPPDTPEGAVKAVLAGMRENLLLSKLRQNLTTEQDRLLRAACLYRVPVNYDGLHLLDIDSTDHDTNRQRLIDYKLILTTYDTRFEMNRFFVPPIARELLKDHGFSPKEFKELNATAGKYHKYQGEHVSRIWSDDIEAIFHFRLAGDHITADELAKSVTYFQYSRSYFKMVNEMCVEIVNRKAPPPPWWALIRYGMCQLTLGNPKKALEAHENALPLSPTEKDRGTTLNNIAQIHKARGELDEATKYLEMSLKIKQEIRDKRGEGTIFNNIATIHYSRGEFDEALKYMELSIKIRQEIGDRTDEGTTLNNISQIHQERGENDEAMKYLKMSLYIYQEIGDRKGEGMTLNNISQIHSAHGEYDEAMKYLEMSLKIQQEIGNRAGEGATLSNIASNHYTRSKFDEALKYFKMSLKIQQEIGDRAGEGATLNNISQIYDARGEYDEAMKYLEMSLKIQEEIGDRAGEGRSLNNIGTINHARGKHKEAMNYLGMSLKIRQEIGDRKGEGMTLNNISQIHYARGELDEAMKYLAQSLKIQQEIGNRAGMIPTLNNMAHIAEQNKDPENAIKMWSEALNIALEIKNAEGIFHFAQALGLRAARDGAKDQAKQLLTMALNVGRQAGFPGTDEIEEDLRKLS